MKHTLLIFFSLLSLNSNASTITCTHGDKPISVKLETNQEQSKSTLTVISYGETVYESTQKAEGKFTNGPLPSWKLTFDGNTHAYFEILSNSLVKKLSMFRTNDRLYCK